MYHLNIIKIETILFLDIETAPNWLHFKDVPENVQNEWIYKFKFRPDAPKPLKEETLQNTNMSDALLKKNEENYFNYFADLWTREAGLYAEFSRVVCISVGYMYQGCFVMKSFASLNEGKLLNDFKTALIQFCKYAGEARLCAHYGKGFDFPFISRRMLINRIELPSILDTGHLKPWEQKNLDTQEIWRMNGANGAGLPALCMAFGLETPKDDLDGSKVAAAFHAGEIERICIYCEKDVFALLNVFKAMRLEEPVSEENLTIQEYEQ